MITATRPERLTDLPLWRLLVLLADTERTIGPDSETARTVASEIGRRLRADQDDQRPFTGEAPTDGR